MMSFCQFVWHDTVTAYSICAFYHPSFNTHSILWCLPHPRLRASYGEASPRPRTRLQNMSPQSAALASGDSSPAARYAVSVYGFNILISRLISRDSSHMTRCFNIFRFHYNTRSRSSPNKSSDSDYYESGLTCLNLSSGSSYSSSKSYSFLSFVKCLQIRLDRNPGVVFYQVWSWIVELILTSLIWCNVLWGGGAQVAILIFSHSIRLGISI